MNAIKTTTYSIFLLALSLTGCVTSDYMGRSYPPTTSVDVYYDEADVRQPFEVMGVIRAEGATNTPINMNKKMQRKLIERAQAEGADGIIIGSLEHQEKGRTETSSGEMTRRGNKGTYSQQTTSTIHEVRVVRARLIKYRASTN